MNYAGAGNAYRAAGAIPVDECSERIDRLLQRVQQTHREYTARQGLEEPEAVTRFDAQQSSGTVSTVSLSESASEDEGIPQRGGGSLAEVKDKLARIRARRQQTAQEQVVAKGGGGGDFFEDPYNVALFRETTAACRDGDWDKRVYYYHLAQSNAAFKQASEAVEIRDCRAECLAEVGLRLHRADVDSVAAMLDDEGGGGVDLNRSFDWSRDGFGHMEFRRLSRALLSPGTDTRSVFPAPQPVATPSPQRALFPAYTDFRHALSRISEGALDEGDEDDEEAEGPAGFSAIPATPVAAEIVDDTPVVRAQIRDVARETRQLMEEIRLARAAIGALTRVVAESVR
ncbi:hypothetical protein GGI04_003197 [Coemansia thaxteri]|uniref:Uncharacterized protein n=1 Tax=Coemansia thaxteri TaxID=2663907 RepID=A0A9W8BGS5_9FUNG|nr:hypothetical protein H4R26_004138 [Coemansia thaxteri]KAJ2002790.1 hypothetical protein GGI04_003197 [Coemansia thaxteri]KAJ2470213.1 hypothetical protein GGI02_003078 [Coemansia sp. RSA 2322]KAJ2480233.1 hypothetical protein EV174_003785 [Coemansia sp. RSA 2320]